MPTVRSARHGFNQHQANVRQLHSNSPRAHGHGTVGERGLSGSAQGRFTRNSRPCDVKAIWRRDTGRMTAYRLRIEVPLEPLATRVVADAIDELGGDIVAVDLREVDGPHAIDEMVVEFEDPSRVHALSRKLDTEPSTTLLSSQRCERGEPAARAMSWVRTSADLQLEECTTDLSAQLRAACPMARVELRAADDVRSLPVVSMALERGGPVVQRHTALVDAKATPGGPAPKWLLAAADSYPDAGRIALLERPMALRFSAYDAARVNLLIGATRH